MSCECWGLRGREASCRRSCSRKVLQRCPCSASGLGRLIAVSLCPGKKYRKDGVRLLGVGFMWTYEFSEDGRVVCEGVCCSNEHDFVILTQIQLNETIEDKLSTTGVWFFNEDALIYNRKSNSKRGWNERDAVCKERDTHFMADCQVTFRSQE